MAEALGDAIRLLALAVAPKPRIMVLTGAGISAESGLRTYRGPEGLYSDGQLRSLVSTDALQTKRDEVLAHMQRWREQALAATPNAAHLALAQLEGHLGRNMTVVTQNVDTLHERAGSRRVFAMHGDLATMWCQGRHRHIQPWVDPLTETSRCEVTHWRGRKPCGAPLRPHVVLFGEPVLHGREIERALRRCTTFWAIGTSGSVMPAAALVLQARLSGAETALFNLTPPGTEAEGDDASLIAAAYHHIILGKASETIPAMVNALIKECG